MLQSHHFIFRWHYQEKHLPGERPGNVFTTNLKFQPKTNRINHKPGRQRRTVDSSDGRQAYPCRSGQLGLAGWLWRIWGCPPEYWQSQMWRFQLSRRAGMQSILGLPTTETGLTLQWRLTEEKQSAILPSPPPVGQKQVEDFPISWIRLYNGIREWGFKKQK